MIRILRRRWWLILLPVAIGTLIGTGVLRSFVDPNLGSWRASAHESAADAGTPEGSDQFGVTMAWMLGGLSLGLALAFLIEHRASSFRTEDDVRRLLGVRVLAAVPIMASEPRPRHGRRKWTTAARMGFLIASAGFAVALILWSLQS